MIRLFKLWISLYLWFHSAEIEIINGFYCLTWRQGSVELCVTQYSRFYFAQLMSYYFIKQWIENNSLGIRYIGDFAFVKAKKFLEKTEGTC